MSLGNAATVFRNCAVYTANRASPWVQAVAIQDGRILAVGSDDDVRRQAGANPLVIDLKGRMVMPGVIDMHNHVLEGARAQLFELLLKPSQSFDEVIDAVRGEAARRPAGQWISGAGWGPAVAGRFASREGLRRLDEVSPNHPVILKDISYHSRVANSLAIAAANLPEMEARSRSGEIARDGGGLMTGLFHETAAAAMDAAAPAWSDDQLLAAARHGVKVLNGYGVTGFNLAVASRRTVSAFRRLDDLGEMTARMAAYIDHDSPLTSDRDGIGADFIASRSDLKSPRVGVDFAKFFMDGVPSLSTASVLRDYADGTSGKQSHYTVDELADLMTPLDRQGMSVKIHAIGDRAIRDVLDAIAKVRERNGPGPRHQIAHLTLIHEDDIPRLGALNLVADLCPPMWFPSAMQKRLAEMLGPEYVARSQATRSIIESGALAAVGTDWPAVAPTPSPWPGMSSLITRKNPSGEVPGQHRPDQAIDIETALPLFTLHPAKAMGLDRETGSLEVGKSADLIILDRNVATIPPEEIVGTKVMATYFEGRCVHGGV